MENIQKITSEKSIEAEGPELKNRGLLVTGLIYCYAIWRFVRYNCWNGYAAYRW